MAKHPNAVRARALNLNPNEAPVDPQAANVHPVQLQAPAATASNPNQAPNAAAAAGIAAAAPRQANAATAANPVARPNRSNNGSRNGRRNYTRNELERLMEDVRAVLPISGSDWEVIKSRHSQYFPNRERTWEQLKKKFWNLANKRIPTGDPNMPWEVQEAKSIRHLIIERTDGARGSPSEEFEFACEDDSDAEEGVIGAVFGDKEGGASAAANELVPPSLPDTLQTFALATASAICRSTIMNKNTISRTLRKADAAPTLHPSRAGTNVLAVMIAPLSLKS
jgi:hypothetical protein